MLSSINRRLYGIGEPILPKMSGLALYRSAKALCMQIPRFFLTDVTLDFEPGRSVLIAEPGTVNQIRNVLRMRPGQQIVLLDGQGRLCQCTLVSVDQRSIECTVESVGTAGGDPDVHVTIGMALIKGERFEWALQKLAEIGVASIVPIITTRTVVRLDLGDAKGAQSKLSRWQAILKEAAEQCERGTIPHIVPPKKLTEFIEGSAAGGTESLTFICVERLQVASLKDIFLEYACGRKDLSATKDQTITLVVGPEGGFTDDEIEYAQSRGAKPVSLGPRILRAETAAIYAAAQVIWCLEK